MTTGFRIVFTGIWKAFIVLALLTIGTSPLYAQEDGLRDPIVWDIDFSGNETYSNMLLRANIATDKPGFLEKILGRTGDFLFNENNVRRDVIRIERFYQRRGFTDVRVDYIITDLARPWKKRVTFNIQEGLPVIVRNVEVRINGPDDVAALLRESQSFTNTRHDYRPGTRYQTVLDAEVEGHFIEAMEESGFAYATVSIDAEIDTLGHRVDLTIVATPGSRTYFDQFIIEGEETVNDAFILKETALGKGDIYSRSRMQRAQRELFNHHLFRFATIGLPEQPQDSTLDVQIRVREFPLRTVEASLGVGREELIRGELRWLHRNVFGIGHRFSASGRTSFIEQRIGLDYLIPYVFNTRSSFVSNPYGLHRIEPAYELFRAGFSNSLIFRHSQNFTSSVSYELTVNEELSGRTSVSLPDSVLNYNTAALTLSSYYSQSGPQAEKGWVIQPSLEISSLLAEGSFGFQKGTIDIRRYTPLTGSLTLANRVQAGGIYVAVQDSLPTNIRYFSGGTNTVRGWNRQMLGPKRVIRNESGTFNEYVPTGGRALFLFNIELRQRLDFIINGLGIALFFDGGQVWQDFNDFNPLRISHLYGRFETEQTTSLQFGTGGGLSYESPIGPIRFDLGYKLNPTLADLNIYQGIDQGGGGRWTVHFSIGQAF